MSRGPRSGIRATRRYRRGVVAALALIGTGCASTPRNGGSTAPDGGIDPPATYWVYVGAESADLLHRVRFGPGGAVVEKTTEVGTIAVETEGPHGLAITPDGRHLLLTTGHGVPDGMLWKFEAGPDTLVAPPIFLGFFPATLDVTPDGLYAFVVNFNLHGEHVPSTVSAVYLGGEEMMEVAQTETCTMPHGSRVHPEGTRHYSACMMDDQLVELDTRTYEVTRRFSVATGNEGALAAAHAMGERDEEQRSAGHAAHAAAAPSCKPTWAQPAVDGTHVYVACNGGTEILEVSADRWELTRRFQTGRGPYNLAISPDGRLLVATLKAAGAVEFIDLSSGQSLGLTETSTTLPHGVVVSPDSRWAFVSVEGVGAEPGKVDIFDLGSFERVASVEVGQQASGIAFWRMESR